MSLRALRRPSPCRRTLDRSSRTRRHFATIGVTVPTKPAKPICVLGEGNIGRGNDAQHEPGLGGAALDHLRDRVPGHRVCRWRRAARTRRRRASSRRLAPPPEPTAAGASMRQQHQAHRVPDDESVGGVGGVAAFAAAGAGGGHPRPWGVDGAAVDGLLLGRTGSTRHAGHAVAAGGAVPPVRCRTSGC